MTGSAVAAGSWRASTGVAGWIAGGWAPLPAGRQETGPTWQFVRNGMERLLDGNSFSSPVEDS